MNKLLKSNGSTCRCRRNCLRHGAVVVEMACIAPFLFLLTFAAFEFTRLEFLKGMVEVASYDAARYVMVPGALKQEADDLARSRLALCGAKNAVVLVQAFDVNGEQPEITDTTISVSVRVELPVANNIFSMARFVRDQRIVSVTKLTSEYYDDGT